MKKVFRLINNGIVTAFILLTLFVSCGNLDNEKLASIVISFGNARSEIPYQKSDVSYYIAIITPDPNKEGEVIIDNQKTSHEFAELPSGKYSLDVYAYNEKDILVAEGSDEEIEVNPGETAQAHVTMKLKAYHVHDFAEEWTCDETHHWHAATCGHDNVKDKAEHAWDNGTETKPATCTETGILTYTCNVCTARKTEVIPAQGHVWDEYTYNNDATDESAGTKTRTCFICGDTETLPANGPNTATYQFTETVQSAPAGYSGTMESAGETGRYVIFGDFPQTVAESGVTFNPRPEDNGYYVGSDGCYYEKVEVGTSGNTFRFNNGSTITQNTSHYIKVEPIVWRVLTTEYDLDGKEGTKTAALLFSEKILTKAKFYPNGSGRTINNITIQPNNYKYSTVRAYLNGRYEEGDTQEQTYTVDGKVRGFLQMAFTENAQNLVNFTTVNNAKETIGYDETSIQKREGFVCDDTIDRIFLLSDSEFVSSEYGFKGATTADDARKLALTDYAKTFLNDYQFIWERSPNDKYNSACTANSSNSGYASGGQTINELFGVVPALTVPVSALPAQ